MNPPGIRGPCLLPQGWIDLNREGQNATFGFLFNRCIQRVFSHYVPDVMVHF
jgi:hypothetical protein